MPPPRIAPSCSRDHRPSRSGAPGCILGSVETSELQHLVRGVIEDPGLTYRQRVQRLAGLAEESLDPPAVGEACREALNKRVICDMYEGHAPVPAPLRAARLRPRARPRLRAPRAAAGPRPRRGPGVPAHLLLGGALDHGLPGLPRRPRHPARAVRRRRQRRRAAPQAAAVLDQPRPDVPRRVHPRRPGSRRRPGRPDGAAPGARAAAGRPQPHPAGRPPAHPRRPGPRRRRDRLRLRPAAPRQPPDDGRRPR